MKLKLQYFGHLMQRADSLEKTLMLGKIEGRKRSGRQRTEDEMIGWYHWLNGHEGEQAPRDGEGLGSLACCSPWGRKESDMTERLNNTNIKKTKQKNSKWEYCTIIQSMRVQLLRYFGQFLVRQKKQRSLIELLLTRKKKASLLIIDSLLSTRITAEIQNPIIWSHYFILQWGQSIINHHSE